LCSLLLTDTKYGSKIDLLVINMKQGVRGKEQYYQLASI
jgi:hypothetical protein